jgi:hypothetical protein
MLRIGLNSKTLFWVIVISTLLLITITSMFMATSMASSSSSQLKANENQ